MHKCKRAIANMWFVFSKHVEKLTFHGFLSNQLLPKRSYSHPGERNHACVLSGRGLAEVNIEKSDILQQLFHQMVSQYQTCVMPLVLGWSSTNKLPFLQVGNDFILSKNVEVLMRYYDMNHCIVGSNLRPRPMHQIRLR